MLRLRLLILVAFLMSNKALSVDAAFKSCSEISFCSKFRNQTVDEDSVFSANIHAAQVSNNIILVPLYNQNGDILDLEISLLAGRQIRVKVLEAKHSRYELSDVLDKEPIVSSFSTVFAANESVYFVSKDDPAQSCQVYSEAPFRIAFYYNDIVEVVLKGDQLVIENTNDSQAFSFEVEFTGNKLYGLFNHAYKLALGETADYSQDPFRFRNSDAAYYGAASTAALYGTVPVIYGHSTELTSGIFLHNAAEQWVDINYNESKASAYFMVESGTLDLFVLLGPTPRDVVRQFTHLTGVAHMPQLWTLGYHQSRYSYPTQQEVKDVVAKMNKNGFPMDAIWLDIDYTDGKRYFTWNPENFTDPVEMQANLSSTNKKLVTIIDPHIKVDEDYPVYVGAKENYFAKWENGSNFEGQCWPGLSSYLDFLNPEARDYYAKWFSYEKFSNSTETLAGIWNDMNEPSVFDSAYETTMPFEVLHYGGVPHRDIHNIYGFLQTMATHQGLMERDNGTKRPFILTRSHFAGSQRYAAMWTGDNVADWPYLAVSYSECMTSNIVGMVFCGADIGGFLTNPENELLERWYQAGVWLPFFRGHSTSDVPRREPYLFPTDVQNIIRNALKLRYKHIPVWYLLFYEHTRYGDPIIRPLFYNYPEVFERDDHVLVGSDILARPVMEPNVTSIEVYFPGSETFWYRVDDDSWTVHAGNSSENIAVDIATSPYYYRAGSIIPRKDTEQLSTVEQQDDSYTLYINLDIDNYAEGRLYLDDFESFKYSTERSYFYLNLTYMSSTNGIHLSIIDGNPDSFAASFRQIVVHNITSATATYTMTFDGTPLYAIDIVKQMNRQISKGITLRL